MQLKENIIKETKKLICALLGHKQNYYKNQYSIIFKCKRCKQLLYTFDYSKYIKESMK